jgi:hypothetical protein
MLKNYTKFKVETRSQRRAAVKVIIECLSAVRDAEINSLERIPENFRDNESYEVGELAVEAFDDVIDSLNDVY